MLLAILSIFTSEVRCFLGLVSESCPKTEEPIKNIQENNSESNSDTLKSSDSSDVIKDSDNSFGEWRDSETYSSQWVENDHIKNLDDGTLYINKKWFVIAGTFRSKWGAQRHVFDLKAKNVISYVTFTSQYNNLEPNFYIVVVGAFDLLSEAKALADEIIYEKSVDVYIKPTN